MLVGTTWDECWLPPELVGGKPCRDWGHPGPNKSAPAQAPGPPGEAETRGTENACCFGLPHLWVTGAQVPPEHSPPFLVLWSGQAGAASTLRSGKRI